MHNFGTNYNAQNDITHKIFIQNMLKDFTSLLILNAAN